jgi:cellulose synthase/poly-beta-1,6-N-acetylglucosamine synthase-like glycosyltransferase
MSLTACDWYFWTVAALGGLFATSARWSVRSIKLLPPGRPGAGSTPTCTVVVAARDEQAGIEATVRGLLAQEGVDLRVVVVDDRSTDQTGTILRAVAATDPRLSVVRIDHLPEFCIG